VPDTVRLALLAQTYTPGTVSDEATQNGSTGPNPRSSLLGQTGAAPMSTPVLAVVIVLAVLFLFERRRIMRSLK
jgi:hypothetical protein